MPERASRIRSERQTDRQSDRKRGSQVQYVDREIYQIDSRCFIGAAIQIPEVKNMVQVSSKRRKPRSEGGKHGPVRSRIRCVAAGSPLQWG